MLGQDKSAVRTGQDCSGGTGQKYTAGTGQERNAGTRQECSAVTERECSTGMNWWVRMYKNATLTWTRL